MRSSQNVAIVKIPFCSRAMAFSNNRLLFLFPWERGFAIGNSGTQLAAVVILEAMYAFARLCYIVRLRVYVTVNSGVV